MAQKELEEETVDASRCARYGYDPGALNISLPKCVLEGLDRKASARGMTRSALIAKAAQAYM